jgi:hypothetical protein
MNFIWLAVVECTQDMEICTAVFRDSVGSISCSDFSWRFLGSLSEVALLGLVERR